MATQRPVFLDIFKMRFPIMAMISISHRICGVLLFLFIPFAIYLLHASVASAESFEQLSLWLHQPGAACLVWLMLSATAFHFFAGIRHIVMDCGLFEPLQQAKVTAVVVIALTMVSSILLGVWVW